jgi:hypothetical protein
LQAAYRDKRPGRFFYYNTGSRRLGGIQKSAAEKLKK